MLDIGISDSVESGRGVRWQAELGLGCSGVVREREEPREGCGRLQAMPGVVVGLVYTKVLNFIPEQVVKI